MLKKLVSAVTIACESTAVVRMAALKWLQPLIKMAFEVVGWMGPNNHVLQANIGSIPMQEVAIFAEMQRIGRMQSGNAALPKLLWGSYY